MVFCLRSDITAAGDSYATLASADPILNVTSLRWGAEAYAPLGDQKNPYVSPVYGDYSKAFPPTLIQVGTREIFLSNAVRQYQAIRGGGHEAVLDVYEGYAACISGADTAGARNARRDCACGGVLQNQPQ